MAKGESSINPQFTRPRSFSPIRSVIVITQDGPKDIAQEYITVEQVGLKAYGLSSLPLEWTLPFLVIASSCLVESVYSDAQITNWVSDCLVRLRIPANRNIIVRSSGINETIQRRGQFGSMACLPDQTIRTIRSLMALDPQQTADQMHWVIQESVHTQKKGHLSNERQLSKENRDWVAELEVQSGNSGYSIPIAVRKWRDGTCLHSTPLICNSELEISHRLKPVALWGTRFSARIHFEWVWDGKFIYVVQADEAEIITGTNPQSILPTHIYSADVSSLKAFHVGNLTDYERYAKLRNAKLYKELGYDMPSFYVLDKPELIARLLSAQISSELEDDLVELTRRPLIIRTDGTSIPIDKEEMLPRSDELRSYAEGRDWLLNYFRPAIIANELNTAGLCLICHHFIPSVASAWARAEPGNRIVRIESLWGLPEGLYWHSHDTFEVDTQDIDVSPDFTVTSTKYEYRKKLRFKGTFVAANDQGKWVQFKTATSHDWAKSIRSCKWLFEIAHTTKRIAKHDGHAVVAMWFIDNHPEATPHIVLPWYHKKSDLIGTPKAAPRQKRKHASDVKIKRRQDLEQLQHDCGLGKYIERVVVEPDDPDLIRNPVFARQLADLAKSRRFVIELAGGILSHAYYILQRHGASVECVDLFGGEENIVEYNKLVRDNIPDFIEGRGEQAEAIQLKGDALAIALRQKIVEEAFEALDAKSVEELIGELADIQEVTRALCHLVGVSMAAVESERGNKEKRRGGFEKGQMLVRTTTAHSISRPPPNNLEPVLDLSPHKVSELAISDSEDLPATLFYRRPDLRQVDQHLEKLFVFQTEVNKSGKADAALQFSLPRSVASEQSLTLTVELHRVKSSIRGTVRIRLDPTQLSLSFPPFTKD